ncbi:MAG: flagellar filament capping protein FliD [Alphaproteobacteria bacterium]|nr:flagellar filament capping protein FliD [Alphaproteobacteria bacterium]
MKGFNDLNAELNKNQKLADDGKSPDKDAILFGNKLLIDVKNLIYKGANSPVNGGGALPLSYLAQAGITLNYDSAKPELSGSLSVDTKKLEDTVYNKFDQVKQLFGNNASSTNSNFKVWDIGRTLNPIIAGALITVTYTGNMDGTFAAVLSTPNQVDVTINPVPESLIQGPPGSIYDGFKIGYMGAAVQPGQSVTTTMTVTQGIADPFNSALKNSLKQRKGDTDQPQGLFDKAIDQLLQVDKRLQKRIDDINTDAAEGRRKIETRMAAVYESYNKYRSILNMLTVFNKTNKDS